MNWSFHEGTYFNLAECILIPQQGTWKGLSSVILILTLGFTTAQAVLVSLHLRVCFWTASKTGCESCALQLDCHPHQAFSKDGATNLPTPDIYARHCQLGSMSPRKAIFWILGCWKLIANTQAINSPDNELYSQSNRSSCNVCSLSGDLMCGNHCQKPVFLVPKLPSQSPALSSTM